MTEVVLIPFLMLFVLASLNNRTGHCVTLTVFIITDIAS